MGTPVNLFSDPGQKTLAFLHDKILELTPKEKGDYNKKLAGLRDQEQQLLEAEEQATQTDLKKDFQELEDLLADIPGRLDGTTMMRKQKLAKPISFLIAHLIRHLGALLWSAEPLSFPPWPCWRVCAIARAAQRLPLMRFCFPIFPQRM
jgi:hypothetical protein